MARWKRRSASVGAFSAALNKGGRFVVQQGTMGTGVWQVTRMHLDFTGKILFFKKLVIKSTQTFSDFHEAPPNLTFAQGVELLKKQAQELAENRPQIEPQIKARDRRASDSSSDQHISGVASDRFFAHG